MNIRKSNIGRQSNHAKHSRKSRQKKKMLQKYPKRIFSSYVRIKRCDSLITLKNTELQIVPVVILRPPILRREDSGKNKNSKILKRSNSLMLLSRILFIIELEENTTMEVEKNLFEEMVKEKSMMIETMRKSQDELEEKVDNLTKILEEIKTSESNLKQEIEVLNKDKNSSQVELEKRSAQLFEANKSLKEMTKNFASIEKKLQEISLERDELLKKEVMFRKSITEMAEKDDKIKKLEEKINSLSKNFEKLSEYVKEPEEFFELLKSGKAHYEHKCNLCKGSLITNSYVLNCGCLAFCNKCSYKLIRERKKCLICKNFVLTRHLVFIDSMRVKWIRKNHTQDDIIQVE